eukprot:2212715-Amphidinium_carterae.1
MEPPPETLQALGDGVAAETRQNLSFCSLHYGTLASCRASVASERPVQKDTVTLSSACGPVQQGSCHVDSPSASVSWTRMTFQDQHVPNHHHSCEGHCVNKCCQETLLDHHGIVDLLL